MSGQILHSLSHKSMGRRLEAQKSQSQFWRKNGACAETPIPVSPLAAFHLVHKRLIPPVNE